MPKNMGSRAPLLGLALSLAVAGGAAAQQPVVFRSNALEVSVNGRVQTQLNTTTVETEPAAEIALRRVRLEATVKVNEWVTGKIQPDFAGSRVTLKDAWVKFAFAPGLQLLAGQAHRPFGTIVQTSSARILPVERGARIRGLSGALDHHNLIVDLGYADRDVGIQLLSDPERVFSYAAGVFNGPARAQAAELDSYQLAARAAFRPAKRLKVGASYSGRDFVVTEGEPEESRRLLWGNAVALDVEYGAYAPGLHLVGELSYGDYNPSVDARFLGAQGWLGYRTGALGRRLTAAEPVLRVSHGDPSANGKGDEDGGGTLVTPGLNFYFGPLNRIMLNYDLWLPDAGGDREGSFKAQFQVAF
ncbi:MAG TPA: porin [Longimicrobiaceae bacterium]